MPGISVKIIKKNETTAAVSYGEEAASLVYSSRYEEGDRISVEIETAPSYLVIQLDDAIGESLVYLSDRAMSFSIPFAEKKICYSPKSFRGDKHLLTVRYARESEIDAYRNLACNKYDTHEAVCCYPHASANVETRNEAVFAARNAIDGIHENTAHGEWPYGSWGINRDPKAKMRLDFGRSVGIDTLVFYLRADFPHDSWWTEAEVTFSDGTKESLFFEKTGAAQRFPISPRQIEWLEIGNLKKAEDPSPFPALAQLEVYGTEVK